MDAAARPLLSALPLGEPRLPLGTLLLRERLVTSAQLESALAEKEASGRRLGEIVTGNGWVSHARLAALLAEQHGLESIDLGRTQVDPSAASLLPEKFARRYEALPVQFLEDDAVLVAVADPTNIVTSDDLRLALGMNVRVAVASAADLTVAIERAYRTAVDVIDDTPEVLEDPEAGAGATSAPAIKLVNELIARAVEEGASDVHFEPQAKQLVVRARVDGVMRRFTTVPKSQQPAITSRLKIMAELDIAEKRTPQDGRISIRYGGQPMDIRVACLPTTHGEQVVLRVMNRAGSRLGLAELGMSAAAEATFARAIRQPYGCVLAVGPTGSGKTTTLYAALDVLNEDDRVLMTIEDPVEHQTPGVSQIEVNFKSGLTFARGLRTILRSDPDVLLVGEVRDEETARIAIQAAMTGHLVLTTLHTHNAASSIARLVDMGVEPSLIATSINCIVAQRLARRLCVHCREAYWPEHGELDELGPDRPPEDQWLYRPVGCVQCAGTGFSGRVALYEVMAVQGRMRSLIASGSTEEIFAEAVAQGMSTLRQDGIRLALAGLSSLDEVRRVTGDRLV
ncbi:MAG TPA: GspE/PulE family protein [Gaiellaceae bacterium]|nr:GspE/PulE family protein [Gaiellaceae bacterium]